MSMRTISSGIFLIVLMLNISTLQLLGREQKEKKKKREKDSAIPERVVDVLHPKPTKNNSRSVAGIKLLPGYNATHAKDFEGNEYGEIEKRGGLKITYQIGLNQGQMVKTAELNQYIYYYRQIVDGRSVLSALTKEKIFIVSVPLNDKDPNHAANFLAKVEKPEAANDMLVMALSLLEK